MTETELVQINFPKKLLEVLDELWPGLYSNRTAAIVEAVRRFTRDLEEEKRVHKEA